MTSALPNNRLPPLHPGEFLQELLDGHALTQAALARALNISPMRISHVVRGERPVTAELALLLGRAFNQAPQYWLNLQATYDLKLAERALKADLRKVRPLAA